MMSTHNHKIIEVSSTYIPLTKCKDNKKNQRILKKRYYIH